MRWLVAALLINGALGWLPSTGPVLPLRQCGSVSRQNCASIQMQMVGPGSSMDRRAAGGLLVAGALFGLSNPAEAANGITKSSTELQREVASLEKEVPAASPFFCGQCLY